MNAWAPTDFLILTGRHRSIFANTPPDGAVRLQIPVFDRSGIDLFLHESARWKDGGVTLGDWPDAPGCRIEISKDQIDLISDTEGVKHVFYAPDEGCIAGTRIEDLVLAIDPDLDPKSFEEMLAIGYPLADRTLYEGIRRVDPASRVRFQDGDDGVPRFSSSTPVEFDLDDDPDAALDRLAARTAGYCEDGALIELSGGFDSRLVLALAIRGGASKIRALTLGGPDDADTVSAKMLAEASGLEHIIINGYEQRDSDELDRYGRQMMRAGGYQLNFAEYAAFPSFFKMLEGKRTSQINGLGGELYTGSFDTPGDVIAAKSKMTRRFLLKQRIINSSNMFHLIWPTGEAKQRLADVVVRLDDEVQRYRPTDWRMKMRAYYRLTKMRNWGGAVTSASSRWYTPHAPLWSRDFRIWSLAEQSNSERLGQRELTNRLAPAFREIPYQKELEERADFRSKMQHRSNSVAGKVLLRLTRRRWLSGGAIDNTTRVLNSGEFQSGVERLRSLGDIGNPDFSPALGQPVAKVAHPVGVAVATFYATLRA